MFATAVLIIKAIDNGLISLDDTLPKFFEGVPCLTRLEAGESMIDDYNVRRLRGIPAGNGGNYCTMHDIRLFVRALLDRDERLYSKGMFDIAEANYTGGLPVLDVFRGTDNRGLGFVHVNESCYQACDLFPDGSIGHEGYTGQSFFLCREPELYVIFLSNATRCTVKKYGKANYVEVCDLRAELHRAIAESQKNKAYKNGYSLPRGKNNRFYILFT